ncbi:TlpA family protein disulfide reductase [Shewanella baltica]|uniref:Alkyl hydroperoxide reductase/ Thiol specific antioxidant/ Mal allergen n=1 Tax=Shewanella baltica (strain OS155 / ATCC BAA-1091) TaxID=325240 RepID=A3CZ55_SHEB5|nr:TlpA disulfide reductase family protein [Shewanella baltica]ABN59768.1 alkyl hydroperoxide reductase/ Thiol specific antioxidant/ Mal allergen [Shewanella baltica OS155]AEH12136.1 alkyl hydroperoxide reductase/ Thiol specific antioxidant/ Mal allergen [Shewanella baltica OS117]KZK68015.1 alkyl hydroperoxide reductase [Shewanella baltica]MCS6125324.1 TlpA family protein disulfide reductase [Shewanella baltica]MCS6129685.1 TlpA family protein disulfide reductase [Shewanella baltica]
MKHKVIKALLLSSLFSLLAGGVAHAYPGMQQATKPMESTVDLINVLPKTFPIEPVAFNDVDGKAIDFSQFKGKIIMVNMWATWCPPCVRELPAIERLATKFKAEDFVLLPISIDAEGKQQVQPFLNSLGMPNFNSYYDQSQSLGDVFPLDTIPATFILDQQGQLIAFVRSYVDWDDAKAVSLIQGFIDKGSKKPN